MPNSPIENEQEKFFIYNVKGELEEIHYIPAIVSPYFICSPIAIINTGRKEPFNE